MRRQTLILLLAVLATVSCIAEDAETTSTPSRSAPFELAPEATYEAIVRELIPASGYLYLRVEGPSGSIWVVSLKKQIRVGQRISVRQIGTKSPFKSRILDREFESMSFAVVSAADQS